MQKSGHSVCLLLKKVCCCYLLFVCLVVIGAHRLIGARTLGVVMGTSPKITNRTKSNRPGYESNQIESVIESNCPSIIMQVNPKGFPFFLFYFYLLYADNQEGLLLQNFKKIIYLFSIFQNFFYLFPIF